MVSSLEPLSYTSNIVFTFSLENSIYYIQIYVSPDIINTFSKSDVLIDNPF